MKNQTERTIRPRMNRKSGMTRQALVLVIVLSIVVLYPFTAHAAGENPDELLKLQTFLNQPSAEPGFTNAQKLNYDPNDTATWTGVVWDSGRVISIGADYSWQYQSLAGDLDLSGFTSLEYINCAGFNHLTSLSVSGDTALTTLMCFDSQLPALDVSTNTALRILMCSDNPLFTLNISANTALRQLYCQNNNLTTLTVSSAPNLYYLDCSNNQLTTIDVSMNPALSYFFCNGNKLSTLDVDANTNLVWFNCADNLLKNIKTKFSGKTITLAANAGGYVEFIGSLDESICNATAVPQSDYVFYDWTSSGTSVLTEPTYVLFGTAELEANFAHSVTFDKNGGDTGPDSITVSHDVKMTEPSIDPTRTGHTFDGWYKEAQCVTPWDFASDRVTVNMTLYAKWTADRYAVHFDAQEGSAVPDASALYDTLLTAPVSPVRTGHDFGGWYKEPACVTAWDFSADRVMAETTLYAKWTTADCTVHFNTQGAGTIADVHVLYNTLLTAPHSPVLSGYDFGGWYKDVDCMTAWDFGTDKILTNITLYAKWTRTPVYTNTPPPLPPSAPITATTIGTRINVRSDATTKSNVLGTLERGTAFKILDYKNGFVQIEYNGEKGWISADYLSWTYANPMQSVTIERVNVYLSSSSGSRRLGSIGAGQEVRVIGRNGQRLIIKYKNETAYVNARSMTVLDFTEPVHGAAKAQTELYTDKSTKSARLITLKKGDRLDIIGIAGGWFVINYNGQTVYVPASRVRLTS